MSKSKDFVCESCNSTFTRKDSLNRHINTICSPSENMEVCDYCGNHYTDLGNHYFYNPSHRPGVTSHQSDIITGVLMGDGRINRNSKNPRFCVEMVAPEYIEYLSSKLSPLVSCVSDDRKIGERNVQQKNCLETITHPQLEKFASWYSSGDKIFPDDINMNPTILKHWYVTDGNLNTGRYPSIRATNESENGEKIESYFNGTPLNTSFSSGTLRFPDSKDKFFEYIGEPLPGFEYKWPDN